MQAIAVLDRQINNVTMVEALSCQKIAGSAVEEIADVSELNAERYLALVVAQGVLEERTLTGETAGRINQFVSAGGICWIMHQGEAADLSWLPDPLRQVKLEKRYVQNFDHPSMAAEYVGPWITDRDHPLWNKPHYLDEGAFVFWDVKIEGARYRTAATHGM